jgi:hypothetical protein
MLQQLRQQSVLAYVLLGAILFIFLFNIGPATKSCSPSSRGRVHHVAKVNGTSIRVYEFVQAYQEQITYLQTLAQYDPNFKLEKSQQAYLRRQVLDELINRELMAQAALQSGLVIGNTMLAEYLQKRYDLKKVGFQQYAEWITQNYGVNVTAFEERSRQQVLASLFGRMLYYTLPVSPVETKQHFSRLHDRVKISYIPVQVSSAPALSLDDVAIQGYEKDHTQAISAYYVKHSTEFMVPPRFHVKSWAQPLADGNNQEQLQVLQDMATLIKKADNDIHKIDLALAENPRVKKEDLHWLEAENLPKAIQMTLGQLKSKQLSIPVYWPEKKAIYMFWLEEVSPERMQALNEVSRSIAGKLWQEEIVFQEAEKKAQKIWQQFTEKRQAWAKMAAAHAPIDSEWLLHDTQDIPYLNGYEPALLKDAFATKKAPEILPKIYRFGQGYVVAAVVDREMPNFEQFAKEEQTLQEKALQEKYKKFSKDFIAHLRNHAKIQINEQVLAVGD